MSGIGSWLATSRANKFFDTYVKGFVDVSGGYLQLRQGNFYMNDGDISLNGKLYATGAATLASTLSVAGDVTVDGTPRGLTNSKISPDLPPAQSPPCLT